MNTQTNTTETGARPNAGSTRYFGNDGAPTSSAGEFRNFITDIEDMIKATTSLTGDDLARAKAKLSARISAAKESVESMSVAFADRAKQTAKATDGYVQENPWKAVGIGAALGVVIGYLVTRR